ncbi:MAG: hypothetical protein KBD53_07420, partial [Candidatus Omnitrophica bacterium]|nr:hypothetical protein [Candidatus Omnitrophota bacterium]
MKNYPLFKISVWIVLWTFAFSSITPSKVHAQSAFFFPNPGVMVTASPAFAPAVMRGIKISPDQPLQFDFIIDTGHSDFAGDELKAESTKLIKYFLATLTIPENELWVNLSPYEKDRIIPDKFGMTEMGRDLLAQDYVLKQLTASLMYPEAELGKKFWNRIYAKVNERYGAVEVPVSTFNKVWIVPETAVVYESGDTAFVIESHLKVMLEKDYLATIENARDAVGLDSETSEKVNATAQEIIKEVILPEIEKEVNEGKNFTALRQVYYSMILATWFKRNLKESLLGQVYLGENKISGVDIEDTAAKEKIYQQYLEAFKVGVYNYIKEDFDPTSQDLIPRKYFSGGMKFNGENIDTAMSVKSVSASEQISAVSKVTEGSLNTALTTLNPVKKEETDFAILSKSREERREDIRKALQSLSGGRIKAEEIARLTKIPFKMFSKYGWRELVAEENIRREKGQLPLIDISVGRDNPSESKRKIQEALARMTGQVNVKGVAAEAGLDVNVTNKYFAEEFKAENERRRAENIPILIGFGQDQSSKIKEVLQNHPGGMTTGGKIAELVGISTSTLQKYDWHKLIEKENKRRKKEKFPLIQFFQSQDEKQKKVADALTRMQGRITVTTIAEEAGISFNALSTAEFIDDLLEKENARRQSKNIPILVLRGNQLPKIKEVLQNLPGGKTTATEIATLTGIYTSNLKRYNLSTLIVQENERRKEKNLPLIEIFQPGENSQEKVQEALTRMDGEITLQSVAIEADLHPVMVRKYLDDLVVKENRRRRSENISALTLLGREHLTKIKEALKNIPGGKKTKDEIAEFIGISLNTLGEYDWRNFIVEENRQRKEKELSLIELSQTSEESNQKIKEALTRMNGQITIQSVAKEAGVSYDVVLKSFSDLFQKENDRRQAEKISVLLLKTVDQTLNIREVLRKHPGGLTSAQKIAVLVGINWQTLRKYDLRKLIIEENKRRKKEEFSRELIRLPETGNQVERLKALRNVLRKLEGAVTSTLLARKLNVTTTTIFKYDFRKLVEEENDRRKIDEPTRKLLTLPDVKSAEERKEEIRNTLKEMEGQITARMVAKKLDVAESTLHKFEYKKLVEQENIRRGIEEPKLKLLVLPPEMKSQEDRQEEIRNALKTLDGQINVAMMAEKVGVSYGTIINNGGIELVNEENERRKKEEEGRELLNLHIKKTQEEQIRDMRNALKEMDGKISLDILGKKLGYSSSSFSLYGYSDLVKEENERRAKVEPKRGLLITTVKSKEERAEEVRSVLRTMDGRITKTMIAAELGVSASSKFLDNYRELVREENIRRLAEERNRAMLTLAGIKTEEEIRAEEEFLDSIIEKYNLDDIISGTADDVDMMYDILLMLGLDLPAETIQAIAMYSYRGLRDSSTSQKALRNYKDFTTAPDGDIVLDEFPTETTESFVKVSGRVEGDFKYVQIQGDRDRIIEVDENGKFHLRLILAKGSRVNLIFFGFNDTNKTRGSPVALSIHQTSLSHTPEEVLEDLLRQKEDIRQKVSQNEHQLRFVKNSLELGLLHYFTEDEQAGLKEIDRRIKSAEQEKNELFVDLYKTIRTKFERLVNLKIEDFKYKDDDGNEQTPYFYQKYAYGEVMTRMKENGGSMPGIILALEQGLGKTLIGLMILRSHRPGAMGAVPNSVVTHWGEDEGRFFESSQTELLTGSSAKQKAEKLKKTDMPIRLVNFEFLRAESLDRFNLMNQKDQIVFIDESQMLSSTDSLQSLGARKLEGGFSILTSGTPFVSVNAVRPILEFLERDNIGLKHSHAFSRLFNKGDSESLVLLRFMLKKYILRIKSRHVFKEFDRSKPLAEQNHRLPAKVDIAPEELGSTLLDPKQEEAILELFTNWDGWKDRQKSQGIITEQDEKLQSGKDENYFSKVHSLLQIMTLPQYFDKESKIDSPKAQTLDQIVEKEVDQLAGKIVINAKYNEEIEAYLKRYQAKGYGVVTYYGDTNTEFSTKGEFIADKSGQDSQILNYKKKNAHEFAIGEDGRPILDDRRGNVKDSTVGPITPLDYNRLVFQNDPKVQIMITNDQTGGVGITLTAGNATVRSNRGRNAIIEDQFDRRINRIDNKRKKYETRHYVLEARYSEEFLQRTKTITEIRRKDGTVEYFPTDSVSEATRHDSELRVETVYDRYFSQGTFDEVYGRIFESDKKVLDLLLGDAYAQGEMEDLNSSRLKQLFPGLANSNGKTSEENEGGNTDSAMLSDSKQKIGGITPKEYNKHLMEIIHISWNNLPRQTREIISNFGTLEDWKELVDADKGASHYLFAYALPELKNLFGPQFKNYWPQLLELGKAADHALFYMLRYGFPTFKELIVDQESLKAVGNQLIEIAKASGANSSPLFQYGLPEVKELIIDQESLKTVGGQLAAIAGNMDSLSPFHESETFFTSDFPYIKELFGNLFKDYWPQLFELGKASGKHPSIVFDGVSNMRDVVGADFIKNFKVKWAPLYIRLAKSVNDYNSERVFQLIFDKTNLNRISRNKGDHAKHLNFYAELLEENPRLGYQILEGLNQGLKVGQVSVKLSSQEQKSIKAFIKKTNGMNPSLYNLYLEKGDGGLKEVRTLAEKALKDELSPQDIRAYQSEMTKKGYKGKEIALAAVAMAIPMSGASFVKREEIMGLFSKYLGAGDRRADIPESLRNFVHPGNKYQKVEYLLKSGEQLDQEGRLETILQQLKYPDSGKSEEEIQTLKEAAKQNFVKTLKIYLADRRNSQKKVKTLNSFYEYVRHNDLLKEKVDAIQGLDYVNLENLGALFSDKDQLRVLLTEVLDKDIEQTLLNQEGAREKPASEVPGFIKQLFGIWNNPKVDEKNKILALSNILKVYRKSDLENNVITQLDSELKEVVQRIIDGELTAQVSKKQIGDELFNPIFTSIETEKNKYESIESKEVIELEYRVVKGAAHGLWGLCAGVCIATDVELWKKKSFSLLSMVDKRKGQVVGYIHLYEAMENGNKVLTIPGIEPSSELLGEVKARDLYPDMIAAIQAVAKQGGYAKIYLPVSETILSNRSDIQKLAKKADYEKITLDEAVEWNTLPDPYPFKEVYVIPTEQKTDSALLSSSNGQAGITKEEYAVSLQEIFDKAWEKLPEETREILSHFGTLKEYAELARLAETGPEGYEAEYLFEHGLPALKEAFGDHFNEYLPGFIELGRANGPRMYFLLSDGLPAVKQLITDKKSLMTIGNLLIELGNTTDLRKYKLLFYCLPDVKELITDEESLRMTGKQIIELGITAGEHAYDLFKPGLLAVKQLITDQESFKRVGNQLIELRNKAGKYSSGWLSKGLFAVKELITDEKSLDVIGNQLIKLSETTGAKLIRDGLPAGKELFGEKFIEYWPEFMELGQAAGKNADALFKNGFSTVKELITDEKSLMVIGNQLIEFARAAGENADALFKNGFSAVKELITDEKSLMVIGNQLIEINIAAGGNASEVMKGLSLFKELITDENSLKMVGNQLIELGEKGDSGLIRMGLPAGKELFGEKFIQYWPELFELGHAAGANDLFVFGFSAVEELITDKKSLMEIGNQLIELGKASSGGEGDVPRLFANLPHLKKLITDQESLKRIGNQLVELKNAGKENWKYNGLSYVEKLITDEVSLKRVVNQLIEFGKAIGKGADATFFSFGLSAVKELIVDEESLKRIGNQLVEFEKAAGKIYKSLAITDPSIVKELVIFFNEESLKRIGNQLVEIKSAAGPSRLLEEGLPGIRNAIGEDFFKNFESIWSSVFLRLARSVNDYNGERVFKLIFSKTNINWISKNKGDHAKHLNFYAELLEENPRLGYQILEGLFEILKSGKVSVDLTDEEQKTIKEFVQKTNGMNPTLYSLYLEKGDEGLNDVRLIAEKALKDELSPEDIRAYQTEMNNQGYKGKELALAAVGMVIPMSGASFVKREEIMGLFDKYLEAGDRRSDIPETLRNFVHTGNRYQKVDYQLKPGEVLDQDGGVGEVLNKLKYPDSGKSEEEIQTAKEKSKQEFLENLKIYLGDRNNSETREKTLNSFYGYVRHNDLLKEKVDAIQGLDYVNLENLGALFSDKDQLRVLLTEVLDKDIEQTLLNQEGQREITSDQVLGLTKQLSGIWNNPKTDEKNKILALGSILKVYKKIDLEANVITQLEGELKKVVKKVVDGDLAAQVSKKQIGDELFNPIFTSIETEKNKYESIESKEVIELEYRVVKGAAHGLWGLCAGVCIATDVELWKKKSFSLLSMV